MLLMRKLKNSVLLSAFTFLAVCCGQQHCAESLVRQFMKDNLRDSRVAEMQCSRVDSTFYISDSLVNVLRRKARHHVAYKSNIAYAQGAVPRKLLFMNVRYKDEHGTTHRQTFYFDVEMTRVICFKGN